MLRKYVVFLVTLLIVTYVGGRLSGFSETQTAQAQAKPPEARKWEYCTIWSVNSGNSFGSKPSANIGIITKSGMRIETWESPHADPLAFALAKLGSEGWEFVGQVEYSPSTEYRPSTWLFKRPSL